MKCNSVVDKCFSRLVGSCHCWLLPLETLPPAMLSFPSRWYAHNLRVLVCLIHICMITGQEVFIWVCGTWFWKCFWNCVQNQMGREATQASILQILQVCMHMWCSTNSDWSERSCHFLGLSFVSMQGCSSCGQAGFHRLGRWPCSSDLHGRPTCLLGTGKVPVFGVRSGTASSLPTFICLLANDRFVTLWWQWKRFANFTKKRFEAPRTLNTITLCLWNWKRPCNTGFHSGWGGLLVSNCFTGTKALEILDRICVSM